MVLDLKQIDLGKEIKDNALWVVEQIPTEVASADVTPILREGQLHHKDIIITEAQHFKVNLRPYNIGYLFHLRYILYENEYLPLFRSITYKRIQLASF